MKYTTTLNNHEPIAITIGNFDGIHRGHQRLMHELRTMAQELGCRPVMVTFTPHTLAVVRPDIELHCLTTLEERLELARRYGGIEDSIVIHFTPQVAALSAQEFLDELRAQFEIKGLVVGANFNFGHNRQGNVAFLEAYGREHDIQVRAIPLEEIERTTVSSTRIRALVSAGKVIEASELLGHPVTISGIVVHGDHRGRLLGFPTANLHPEAHKLLPANGIYAAWVSVESDSTAGSRVYKGAVNVGIRPNFPSQEPLVEAYLLDVELDLYGRRITIDFIARLRDEERFPSIDALKAQMAADVQQARQILQQGA